MSQWVWIAMRDWLALLFQALQAVCAGPVFPGANVGALVLLGRVLGCGLLCPRTPEIHRDIKRHLAGEQRCTHVGQQAL